jgi:hypothetical protein
VNRLLAIATLSDREEEISMKRAVVGELSALRERVDQWRKHRDGARERIPEELWDAAVVLARARGLYATSKALRFNYANLKERVELSESQERGERREKIEAAPFIELGTGQLGGGSKTVVELVGRSGGRVRIDVSGTSGVDIVGLAQAFWRNEA